MICIDYMPCTKHARFIISMFSMHELQTSQPPYVFDAFSAALLLMGPGHLSYATASHSRVHSATEIARHTSWLGMSLMSTEAMSHSSTCNSCECVLHKVAGVSPVDTEAMSHASTCNHYSLYCTRLWGVTCGY